MNTKLLASASACAMALAFAGTANAALLEFFGEDQDPNPDFSVPAGGNAETARNQFLSNLVGVGTEDFEEFAVGTGTPLAIDFPGSGGAITATISGNGLVENNAGGGGSGGNAFGRFNTSPGGSQYWEASSVFTIAFSSPISAFGFYATDIGDFNGQVTLQASNGVVTNLVIPNTVNGLDGSLLFYGFIDTVNSYTSLVFGNTAAGTDFFGFDDMIIGDQEQVEVPVSEPFTAALLGAGLLGFALRRRVRA